MKSVWTVIHFLVGRWRVIICSRPAGLRRPSMYSGLLIIVYALNQACCPTYRVPPMIWSSPDTFSEPVDALQLSLDGRQDGSRSAGNNTGRHQSSEESTARATASGELKRHTTMFRSGDGFGSQQDKAAAKSHDANATLVWAACEVLAPPAKTHTVMISSALGSIR